MTRLLTVRSSRRDRAVVVAAALVVAAAVVVWSDVRGSGVETMRGVELTGTAGRPTDAQARDAAERLTAAVDDLDLAFLDTARPGSRTPLVVGADQSPQQAAAALADEYRFAEVTEAALAEEGDLRAGFREGDPDRPGGVVLGSTERLEDVVVWRGDDGWVVEATLHGAHPVESGPLWEEKQPWLLSVDPTPGRSWTSRRSRTVAGPGRDGSAPARPVHRRDGSAPSHRPWTRAPVPGQARGVTETEAPFRAAHEPLAAVLAAVPAGDWSLPSPCPGWTAGDVVRHLVDTEREWLTGRGVDLGPVPDPDEDPAEVWREHAGRLAAALDDEAFVAAPYEGFFGPSTNGATFEQFYVWDLVAHRWDVATAVGLDAALTDAELDRIERGANGFGEALHMEGICGPALTPAPDADRLTRVLARLGRRADSVVGRDDRPS